MNEEQLIDTYDLKTEKKLKYKGTISRAEAHRKGEWHKVFCCMVISGICGGYVLFQKRGKNKDRYPDKLAITVTSDYNTGENYVTGGTRVINKKLKIGVNVRDITPIGSRKVIDTSSENEVDKEFHEMFLLEHNRDLEAYEPYLTEIEGLVAVPIDLGLQLFKNEVKEIRVTSIEWNPKKEKWEKTERVISQDDFISYEDSFYKDVFEIAKKYFEEKSGLISTFSKYVLNYSGQENSLFMEYVDVLDEEGRKIGTALEDSVHLTGEWHRTAHLWIMNPQKELYLQRREKNRMLYPGLLDISVAGHILVGESSIEAAVREAKEEAGLDLLPKDIKYLFTYKDRDKIGTIVNNEICDVYLVKADIKNEDTRFMDNEVTTLEKIYYKGLITVLDTNNPDYVRHEEEYRKLVGILDNDLALNYILNSTFFDLK